MPRDEFIPVAAISSEQRGGRHGSAEREPIMGAWGKIAPPGRAPGQGARGPEAERKLNFDNFLIILMPFNSSLE